MQSLKKRLGERKVDIQKEREAFENNFKTTGFFKNARDSAIYNEYQFDVLDINNGFYRNLYVQLAWETWQAAKADTANQPNQMTISFDRFEELINKAVNAVPRAKVAAPEWISVDEQLPEVGAYVMVFLGKQGHNPTTYNFCQYTKFGFHLSNVTHWMHLPEAPKAQEPTND